MQELPPGLKLMVRMGKDALAVQAEHGRGAWDTTDGTKAQYVPMQHLPTAWVDGDPYDFQGLMELVNMFDPASQCVVIFEDAAQQQIVAVINVDQWTIEGSLIAHKYTFDDLTVQVVNPRDGFAWYEYCVMRGDELLTVSNLQYGLRSAALADAFNWITENIP